MKKFWLGIVLLMPLPALGQVAALPLQQCIGPAQQAATSGLLSTNYAQGVIPSCTVTLYQTETSTLATYYTSPTGSPQTGSFTASPTGQFLVYSTVAQGAVDVTLSGGIAPNTYKIPYTVTGLTPGSTGLSAYCVSTTVDSLGNLTCTGTITGNVVQAKNMASIGPRYDVTQYGATGNGVTDDTAAIQAAFNACYNNGTGSYGGVVEFPGAHTYLTSATINAFDSCQIEGVTAGSTGGTSIKIGADNPVPLLMNGASTASPTTFTTFTTAANSAALKTASSPNTAQQSIVTITSTANPAVNSWMLITGCSTLTGLEINNFVGQVAASSSSSFTLTASPLFPNIGTYTDSCTATPINVQIAFDSIARYQQKVSNILLDDAIDSCTNASVGVDLYFGSRLDSGSVIRNVDADGKCPYFALYYSAGMIDYDFDDGWRSDAPAQIAQVYVRLMGGSAFQMSNGSLSSGFVEEASNILLDEGDCTGAGGNSHISLHSTTMESDSGYLPDAGGIKFIDCPTSRNIQLRVSLDQSGVACGSDAAAVNCAVMDVSPPNDIAVNLASSNSFFSGSSGVNAGPVIIGMPAAIRTNAAGIAAIGGDYNYAPSYRAFGFNQTSSIGSGAVPMQAVNDFNYSQLWQYNTQASAFLYSDTAFDALPNGVTLQVGQLVAPPAYWAQTSATNERYGLQVVTQAGTVGVPNGGQTTCTSAGTVLTCGGPSAAITSTSCTSNVLTVNTAATTAWQTGQSIIVSGTAESFLNKAIVIALAGGTTTSFTADFPCTNYSNGSDTGTALVSSTTDLSFGQHVNFGSNSNTSITQINSLNPAAITVQLSANVGTVTTPAALVYAPPVLGKEMQLPTKASAAPTAGTWVQGDFEQYSGAAAQGICGFMNIGAGTPGTWTALACPNASGVFGTTQIGSGTPGAGKYVDGGTGAWTALPGSSGNISGGTLGSVVYQSAPNTSTTTAANTTTGALCLQETGTGSAGGAPVWGSCAGGSSVATVSNSDGSLTISPTSGAVVASLNTAHPNVFTANQTIESTTSLDATIDISNTDTGGKDWQLDSEGVSGQFALKDKTDGVTVLNATGTGASFGVAVDAPSISINGSAAITSTSSANSEVPACAPGGTGYQVCAANGNWIDGVTDVDISIASFSIPANTCYGSSGSTTPATASMPGLTTSNGVVPFFTSNPASITGWGAVGGLNLVSWASATNTASYLVCNSTASPITGGSIVLGLGEK